MTPLIVALLLLLCPLARGEEARQAMLEHVGLAQLEALSRETGGPDVRAIAGAVLSGELPIDANTPGRIVERLARELQRGFMKALRLLALPVLVSMLLGMLLDGEGGALRLVCRMACASGLARSCSGALGVASAAMGTSVRIADACSPVLAAALTLTGSGASAAVLSPSAALCVSLIENAFSRVGLRLCALAALVACGGNLSDRFRLDRLFALTCQAAVWGVRLTLIGFVALLTIQGRLAATRDAASANAVGQALRNMVPIIGRSVSDSTGALMESAVSVRSAVGVTGMALAVAVCAAPALRLTVYMLSLRLTAAVIEPVADPGICRIAAGFAAIARVLLALCVGSALMTALLAGSCLGMTG